jgi:energy-coupling factor transporter ATP-binding protein EcfA2
MLKKLYIDNFRCFSNVEISFEPMTLLLGPNGAGKSCVLELINDLSLFVAHRHQIQDLAPASSLTRWDTRREQTFSLTVELGAEEFKYELMVRHTEDLSKRKVLTERLTSGSHTLFLFDAEGVTHLFNDSGEERTRAQGFDWNQSTLGLIREGSDNKRMTHFRTWFAGVQLVRPYPRMIAAESEAGATLFEPSLDNFASWLRGQFEQEPMKAAELVLELREVIGGLESLMNESMGGTRRRLVGRFRPPEPSNASTVPDAPKPYTVAFDELSDGQRLLIALYSALRLALAPGKLLLLDEPDNYLALVEVQPWLNRLQDTLGEQGGQVLLVSHHPEVLDQAALDHGVWMSRPTNGPVRVRPFRDVADTFSGKAPSSEIIARGWTGV